MLIKLGTHVPQQKFGSTPDIDAGDVNEEIWDGTGTYTWLTAATTMTASSSSTNDAAAGSGVAGLSVIYLDANYVEKQVDVVLTGQTGVAVADDIYRVYRAWVTDPKGATAKNAGDIWIGTGTITAGVPAVKYAGVLTGLGQTLMALYTIPAVTVEGYNVARGKVVRWYGSAGAVASARATLALQTRAPGGAWRVRSMGNANEGAPLDEEFSFGINLSPGTDIRVIAVDNGVNNTRVNAGFDIALEVY